MNDITRIVAAVWPHVHDISMVALAAAVVTLGVVILLELRSVLKLRSAVDNSLARVFEQLDLLRFESQQLIEGQQLIETRVRAGAPLPAQPRAGDTRAAATPAAVPMAAAASAATAMGALAAALPATAGEARLLSSLAQARARREAAGGTTAATAAAGHG
jgi:hypothetical protein